MRQIQEGDKVRHKTIIMNGGLAMNVLKIENGKALCEHFEGPDGIHKQTWVDLSELEVIIYGDGGFKNPGE